MKCMKMILRKTALCMLLAVVAGCSTPQATNETSLLPFEQAVTVATDGLAQQTKQLPAFFARVEAALVKQPIVIDPVLDASTGQQTAATRVFEQRVVGRLQTSHPQFEILPFQAGNLAKAKYLLTGTMTRGQGDARNVLQINLALTELKSGLIVAQASSKALDGALDTSPTPYYRDSPVQIKDKVVDGYITTTKTAPGLAADDTYFKLVPVETLINAATVAYNNEHYQDALNIYQNIRATPAGDQLRVLNGIYLAHWKLGHTVEAEQAFGDVVAFGLAYNMLGVKFLFNPGSTQFWSDPKIGGTYGVWLRQIAHRAAGMKVCMNVIGHTSRTGLDQYNEHLSRERATYIKSKLETEVPELGSRLHAIGMGSRVNIIGIGTDDARDALDRRVEFKVIGC
jgi:hypothetical protein